MGGSTAMPSCFYFLQLQSIEVSFMEQDPLPYRDAAALFLIYKQS